jgi:hypothetical protein
MFDMDSFDAMLRGGHPNSLGRTQEVVEIVLGDRTRLIDLINTYGSDDPVVRLRVSSALKRIEAAHPDWITPMLDRLIAEVGPLDQASAQWTLAQLFLRQTVKLTAGQRGSALGLMKRNLEGNGDWIVLNTTMETLTRWAKTDSDLSQWLAPRLRRLAADPRKSVAGRASKALVALEPH